MTARTRHATVGAAVSVAGLVVLVTCGLVARNGSVGGTERRVFRAVNDLPGWLYRPLWIFQQLGNLVVAAAVVLIVAAVLRRRRLAVAAVVAVGAKLVLERVVKALVQRQRPGTSVGHVIRRGSVPDHGLSFVSGHAVITAALAMALMAVLPRRWRPLPWVVVLLNGLARVYVGAHNPLDVVGGAALGLVIGGLLYAGMAPRPAGGARRGHHPVVTSSPAEVGRR